MKYKLLLMLAAACACAQTSNQWTKLSTDMSGARRGSAIRYASKTGAFFLWGFLNDDPDALQENRLLKIPEYDMVFFDPSAGRWQNHLPLEKQTEWSKQLPMGYHPGIYMGITTGSRRTIMRGEAESAEGVPRPALNIVGDQVAYRPRDNSIQPRCTATPPLPDTTRCPSAIRTNCPAPSPIGNAQRLKPNDCATCQ